MTSLTSSEGEHTLDPRVAELASAGDTYSVVASQSTPSKSEVGLAEAESATVSSSLSEGIYTVLPQIVECQVVAAVGNVGGMIGDNERMIRSEVSSCRQLKAWMGKHLRTVQSISCLTYYP